MFAYEHSARYNMIRVTRKTKGTTRLKVIHSGELHWVWALKPQNGSQRVQASFWNDTQSDICLGLNVCYGEPGRCGEQKKRQTRSWVQIRLKGEMKKIE